MFTYFVKVPDLLTLQVLSINMFAFFVVIYAMPCLLHFYPRYSDVLLIIGNLNRYVLTCETADESADQAHVECISILTSVVLASSLSLRTRVVSAEWTSDVIPVLKAHPMECMAA